MMKYLLGFWSWLLKCLQLPQKILFNFLFKSGIFPDCLKIAKVYKQDDETDNGNYRLVSILSLFSKILEK